MRVRENPITVIDAETRIADPVGIVEHLFEW
jgi:hypothetical protein